MGKSINCDHEFDLGNNSNFYLPRVTVISEASGSNFKPRPSPGSF